MIPLPKEWLEQMYKMLGGEYPAFLQALESPPALSLRLNPLRARAGEAALPFIEGAVPWEPLGRYLREGARPGGDIAHWAGAYYIQEASAMAPVRVLNARPGERILDLCAAPGGKSTQIAADMANRGVLVTNDPELSRAKILAGNLERMGAANAIVVCALPDQLSSRWSETFDAILVDAPCSGEGMFRRDEEARNQWNPAAPAGCAARQAGILDAAAKMLRPGGRLVYSTCTLNRVENEDNIDAFLKRHSEFYPEDFALEGVGPSSDGMLKLFPHRLRGDGHFVAKLRRSGDASLETPPRGEMEAALQEIRREICDPPDWLYDMRPLTLGDHLYAQPAGAPDLQGLRIITPGLNLIRIGRSHIEPRHALAMALCKAHRAMPLSDGQAVQYLAGEPLSAEGLPDGWTLITWRDMPLGFGKVTQGIAKNHLPKGLRKRIMPK